MKLALLIFLFPFLVIAQSSVDEIALHLREIPKNHISIDLGIASPIGNYGNIARSGLTAAVTYDRYFNKSVGLTGALRHSYNETAFENSGNLMPQNEKLISLTLGIIASKTYNRFQIDILTRAGLGIFYMNNGIFLSNNDNQVYTSRDSDKETAVVLDGGLRFNYFFRRSVQIYFSPQLQTTLNKPLKYRNSIENVAPSTADNSKELNFSNLFLSLGVKFALGRTYTSGELRDDSLRDN